MNFDLAVSSSSSEPIYRQISAHIAGLIGSGNLGSGDRLPPERELAMTLGVARGTVKKAYEILVNQGLVVAARGRGSVVATHERHLPENRQEIAAHKLFQAIIELEDLNFSHREMADLFGLMLAQRREEVSRFTIAVVDCNSEALGIYQRQLALLTHMLTARFLLSELRDNPLVEETLTPFDLILTTGNHIDELRKLAPGVADKTVAVVVSPEKSTLISLARLSNSASVGVVFHSSRFNEIIGGWLKKSGYMAAVSGIQIADAAVGAEQIDEKTLRELESFVNSMQVLIVPPGYAARFPMSVLGLFNRFRAAGGQVIDFEYQIERGSLMHLEEMIKNLLRQKRK